MKHSIITHVSFRFWCAAGIGLWVAGQREAAYMAFSIPLSYLLFPYLILKYVEHRVSSLLDG